MDDLIIAITKSAKFTLERIQNSVEHKEVLRLVEQLRDYASAIETVTLELAGY